MRSDTSQILLILSGLLVTALFGAFLYREIFPEYRLYQDDYLALEEFRSTYTKQPVPPFKLGVKQIVLEREDKGPAAVDRCTSCHVALQIPYFSPTKVSKDLNGNLVRDENGKPVLIPNEEYIWLKLDEKIAELRDEKVLEQLEKEGQTGEIKRRLAEADRYAALKVAHVGHQTYDVTKVLAMHPLIGNETRPFEFHPIEEYGCTVCHNGNGKGLVTDKAHGPVFDGQYEVEFQGGIPQFTEKDLDNDPAFARVFNDKPGHDLLFQTEPLFVGALIQAKCMQCHQTSDKQLEGAATSAIDLTQKREKRLNVVFEAYEKEKQALLDLLSLREQLQTNGYEQTIAELKAKQSNYILPAEVLENAASQLNYLVQIAKSQPVESLREETINKRIDQSLLALIGSQTLVQGVEQAYKKQNSDAVEAFLKQHQGDLEAKGSLFVKAEALDFNQDLLQHAKETQRSFEAAVGDQKALTALSSDVDELTRNYQRGKELYLSQACFACHRISGLARGGVGPELTRIGESYPWYVKESIVWPQADLKSSTMPNFRLDHQELEDLMAFLLAQKGGSKAVAETSYQASLQAWEAGRKMPWEKPISPADIYDLRYAMTIFATQGCASCHRLQGFESNVGFQVEKTDPSFDKFYEQQVWFKRLFPEVIRFSTYDEELPGSEIVAQIEKHAKEIDERIVADVRKDGILEEIDQNHPEAIEALYSNFRYASRAKNRYYEDLIQSETDPAKIGSYRAEHQAWKDRVHRVLMTYIQVYGFGRLIGPHLNWSGIYRSDEWLMEHFRNPSAHVPRSIMPVMPFDDTKFYALTHMLDKLGIRNRKHARDIWALKGFDPQEAYEMHCAQCHGIGHQGYGVISEWIYPIPKNLKNPDFLRNLTKEEAVRSITHGVRGTPMPPWGEVAEDKPTNLKEAIGNTPVLTASEIQYLVDWIYSSLPGGEVFREIQIPKWRYEPEDILNELKKEGGHLAPNKSDEGRSKAEKKLDSTPSSLPSPLSLLPTGEGYYAALKPEVYSKSMPKEELADYTVDDVFDVIPSNDKESPYHYYIKKKYYTLNNIQEGQKYFLLNCAVCHGNEGDGSGIRGQAMQDAKPRMLTNLDWIQSRDDLRLIRSIKYGVPGTSMTPWGDYTNSLQRIQLVMFIRTLSEERDRRIALDQAVYYAFDTAQVVLEEARIARNEQLKQAVQQEKELQQQQMLQANLVLQGKESPQKAAGLYQQRLEVEQKVKQIKQQDQLLVDMKAEVRRERDLYYNLGVSLIAKNVGEAALESYNRLIRLQAGRYSFDNQELGLKKNEDSVQKSRELRNKIEQELDEKIDELEKEQQLLEGKIISAQRREEMVANQADLDAFNKLKARLITDTEEAMRSIDKQYEILQALKLVSGAIKMPVNSK